MELSFDGQVFDPMQLGHAGSSGKNRVHPLIDGFFVRTLLTVSHRNVSVKTVWRNHHVWFDHGPMGGVLVDHNGRH